MATSKKSPAKPDPTPPPASGDDHLDSLPVDAVATEQASIDTPVEQQDAVLQCEDGNGGHQEPRYRISSRHPNGFWRCGRKWHPDGEVLTLSEIGGQTVLAALRAEPMLIVVEEFI